MLTTYLVPGSGRDLGVQKLVQDGLYPQGPQVHAFIARKFRHDATITARF